jgi:hypothetical protein
MVPLTDAQRNQLLARVRAIWKDLSCEVCRNATPAWQLSSSIYELREYHGTDRTPGPRPVIPVVTAACQCCGNTKFINVVTLGLIDPQTGRWVDGQP